MKKFNKFLGIFLALALVIGLIPVVGAVDPEIPTAPVAPTGAILQGDILEVVSPTKLETLFGYYEGDETDNADAFVDCEDGACVTDGWFGRAGYSECTLDDGTIGLLMTIDEITTIAGIEIVGKNAENCPVSFTVEALVDDAWVELVAVTENVFTDSLTKMFTFDAVETDTVRILVDEVAQEGEQVYFNEVTLFTPATGNLKNVIDMNGKATGGDAHASSNNNWALDGDKSTFFTGSTVTVGLGEATAIDGFNLYHYRSSSFPKNITVNIQKTEGGAFETIGTFATGFTAGAPQDSLYVTFGQTYMAYAVQFVSDVWGYQNDYELWQYQREESTETPTEEPTPAPTEEPTPAPTEEPTPAPTEAPTQAPTVAAPTYNWIDLIPESQLTPAVGYYADGDYTTLTDINAGESGLLTDARVSSGSWVNGNTFPVPSGKVPAAVVEVGGTKIIAGVDICCKPNQELTDFVVEVLDTNGNWVTVNSTTGNTETDLEIVFDTAVVGTAVRVIINDWNGEHPMVQELWIYEGKTEGALVQVPVAGITANQNPVVPNESVENAIDGKGYSYYHIGPANLPAIIIFNTTNADGSATNISRMRIYAYNNSKQAAKDIVVDVKTSNEPETWETVYTGVAYELNHTDTFTLDFGATYAAYDVRLTINSVTSAELVLTEVELFGNGEPVAPPVVTPTDPTETPTEEPTAAPTEEPTAAPTEEPTEAPTLPVGPDGIVNEIVLGAMPSLKSMGVTPLFGYYDNAQMTGSVIDYQAAPGEDACLVDGNVGSSGWSGMFAFADLVDNGGVKVPVILADLGAATTIGGIELISVDNSCSAPTHFEVQVTTSADSDAWETVLTAENVTWNRKETKQFTFDRTVDAYKIRLVVFNLAPLGEETQTQFALHELTLMSAQQVPKVDKIPLSGSNVLQFGYFADLEFTDYRNSVLSNNVPANLFDGNASSLAITNTEAWTWGAGSGMAGNGGTNTAVLTLDVTQNGAPSTFNYMQMVVQGQYRYAPITYKLQVTTSADEDNWETVYEVTDFSWEDNGDNDFYVTFDEVSAYKVRLLVAETHVDQSNLCYFGMGEFVLGTVEIVAPPAPPVDPQPTAPTEEPTQEPTAAPTEEPTVAPTEEPTAAPTETPTVPGEALPETPVVAPGVESIIGVPKTGKVYKIVSPTKLTTVFGYYGADGAFVDKQDGYCVTDGWYGRAGYSECTNADGTIGLIMTMDAATTIGAIEIVGKDAANNPVDFEIQAMVNGEWVTVVDVNEDPFTAGLTKTFTFAPVVTAQVRILVNKVSVETNQCYFNEVSLFEIVDGKLFNKINLTGRISASDAHTSHPATNLVDADKSTLTLANNTVINLTEGGKPTAVDGLALYHYRGGQAQPGFVIVTAQLTEGGEFVSVGSFPTNWVNTAPLDSLFVEFEQTVVAYAINVAFDAYAYVNELELIQYQQEAAPEEPDPTDPTEPSAPATEPSAPATEPSAPATEPSAPATEPSAPATEPSEPTEAPTEPEEEEPTEPTDEPEEDLPEVPELPGLPDITDIEASIDMIYELNPEDYTADSYQNLVTVVKEVNKIISGGFNQAMIDRANEMLTEALAALVPVGGTNTPDAPGGDTDGDEDLPAPTGDIALTVLTGMMSLSAIGGAVVIGKKKFF